MFYELKHSLAADYYQINVSRDLNFSAHMHHCFEWIAVREGEMQVEVDSQTYTLHKNDALMIFPNQIHSFRTIGSARYVLILFSPKLVYTYTKKTEAKKPVNNLFHPDPFYMERLERHTEEPLSFLGVKGILYSLCDAFDQGAVYQDIDFAPITLLYNIFQFIEKNYTSECTLSDLAHHTGYDYGYLSHYFKRFIGISYHDYVTQYRVSQACHLLCNTEMTVLAISGECGFHSLRSLNRNFKEILGMTPIEYRKRSQV